ncbi:MAG TPA: hypothetical protein PKN32_06455 [Bacteroidales bacterium]|nr:hypothetical protein [Bacteroidales bacterium]
MKSNATILITSVIFVLVISCNGGKDKSVKSEKEQNIETVDSVQNENVDISSIEDQIIDKILELPEVKDRADYIVKETNGERHLKIWIAASPKETGSYYLIKAGEDNGMSLVTHFDFHVNPKTLEIKYYDVLTDSELSLSEWREQNKE